MLKLIENYINAARPMISLFGDKAQSVVERWMTIPSKDIDKLTAGMTLGEQTEAKRLMKVSADANSDLIVFLASRGAIEAD